MADRINLLLLPYAGGSAGVFREWKSRLPAWISPLPLTLPGRGARHGEPILHNWPELMALLAREVRPYLDQPFAIFGHSLGALIALELAHMLQSCFGRTPIWLGMSGCTPPSQHQPELGWLDCSEEELLEELRFMKGTPPELFNNRELLDVVIPILRADFHLAGTYEYRVRTRLQMPMLILGGTQDEEAMSTPKNLSAWNDETVGCCRFEMINAGHFFIDSHCDQVIHSVIMNLEAVDAAAARVIL